MSLELAFAARDQTTKVSAFSCHPNPNASTTLAPSSASGASLGCAQLDAMGEGSATRRLRLGEKKFKTIYLYICHDKVGDVSIFIFS